LFRFYETTTGVEIFEDAIHGIQNVAKSEASGIDQSELVQPHQNVAAVAKQPGRVEPSAAEESRALLPASRAAGQTQSSIKSH